MLNSKIKKLIATTMCTSVGLSSLPINITANAATTSAEQTYENRFMDIWGKIHDSNNGYLKEMGDLKIPYYSPETLLIDGQDYGHETTSDTFSYYIWLEAMYGKLTGDWSNFESAWKSTEKFAIPDENDQQGISSGYSPNSASMFSNDYSAINKYPSRILHGRTIKDPLANELKSAYGSNYVYGMHWLLDTDNWYGFGSKGDPNDTSKPGFIDTFQRGPSESVWDTIPHPSYDTMKSGGQNGYLDLFTKEDGTPAKEWTYKNDPKADAAAIQATYWAKQWASQQGKSSQIADYTSKASEMGDFLRYSMYDKYFQPIGLGGQSLSDQCGAHYLLSNEYTWSGAAEANQGNWAYRTGCSNNNIGSQNPMTAWILSDSSNTDFKPQSSNGASDWAASLDRQLEFYQWLQSSEGAIAPGATNSYLTENGSYQAYPSGTSTFYGMAYDASPVYKNRDKSSSTWFGSQAIAMQNLADYYLKTGDKRAEKILDKWTNWVMNNIELDSNYAPIKVPEYLTYSGQPDTWTGNYTENPNLHVKVSSYSEDLGITSTIVNTLSKYALGYSKTNSYTKTKLLALSEKLLDHIWCSSYLDAQGVSSNEVKADYAKMFNEDVYIPDSWTGKMPNGDIIKSGIKFLDIRNKYKADPNFDRVEAAYKAGVDPVFRYHRFWAETETALAFANYSIVLSEIPHNPNPDIYPDGKINIKDYIYLQRYLLDNSIDIDTTAADLNGDGAIDITDALLLKKILMN